MSLTYDYEFTLYSKADTFAKKVKDAIANSVGKEFTSADADAIYKDMDTKNTQAPDIGNFTVTVEFFENGSIKIRGPIEKDPEEESGIDWKFWGKVALFGTACFLLGKRNRRYKEIPKKGIHFDVPGSEVWTPEQHSAVSTFIYSMNECMNKNRIVYHIDRKNRR